MATKKIKGSLSVENVLELPNYSASTVLTVDGSGNAASSSVTTTELGYLDGVTSALQDQLDGKATLSGGKIPSSQLPAIAITEVFSVADIAARDALTIGTGDGEVQEGDVAIVTDASADAAITSGAASYIYDGSAWALLKAGDEVLSINGNTGAVTLDADDISDAATTNKFVTAGDVTKLGFITVTQAVDLDSMESDIAINNGKLSANTTNVDAAGATMNTDSSLVGNSYFLDEDNMASDDPNKVASQQSIKAYVDAQVAGAGGSDFSDDIFRISDNTTSSKKIAFEASGISASTVRTITMPDANVDLTLVNSAVQPTDNISLLTNDSAFVDATGVRATALTGLSLADSSDVVATDSVLVGFGKLQAQVDALSFGAASTLDDLTDVTITGPGEGNDILIHNGAGQFVDKLLSGGNGIILNDTASAVGFDLDIDGMSALSGDLTATGDTIALYDIDGIATNKATVRQITGRTIGDKAEGELDLGAGPLPSTFTDVTGFQFSNTNDRTFEGSIVFEAFASSGTKPAYAEHFRLFGIQTVDGSGNPNWQMSVESVGDSLDIELQVVASTGQIQYRFPNGNNFVASEPSATYDTGTSTGACRFRATTLSTAAGYEGS